MAGKTKEDYEVLREGTQIILNIDAEHLNYVPSIEDSAICMGDTIEKLAKIKSATRIVFTQKREFEYDFNQTQLLIEIATIYRKVIKQKDLFGIHVLSQFAGAKLANKWYGEIKHVIFNLLKTDPISAYVELKRMIRHENIKLMDIEDVKIVKSIKTYISKLKYLYELLENTKLIALVKDKLEGYVIGNRDLYRKLFSPTVKPDFMFTKLMANYPEKGEELANYTVGNTDIIIFKIPGSVKYLYHLTPPEFKLSEEKYEILDSARTIMAEHKPTRKEFVDPERMRQIFYNIGSDLIEELAEYKKIILKEGEVEELTNILIRYTIGFGLIEVLLEDEEIQDVSINSPLGEIPMYIVHGEHGDCTTNIIPTTRDAESWASKLRMISGRALDEANPLLDTEITLPKANSRVSVVSPPLAPTGLAFSFRRHR